jgi:L-2,4-diaminobutyrate decarboxylase
MHEFDEEIDALAAKILEYSLIRLKKDPPLDGPWSYEELYSEVGETITANGLGGDKALDIFKHVLAQACISTDHGLREQGQYLQRIKPLDGLVI